MGENKPASNHLHQDRPVSRVHGGHLQYFFIHQDGGEAIPKGHGAKHQDIKQVHLLFSGNLDEQRPVEVTLPSYVKAYKNSSAQLSVIPHFILSLEGFQPHPHFTITEKKLHPTSFVRNNDIVKQVILKCDLNKA